MKRFEITLDVREGEVTEYSFELGPDEVRAEFKERGCPELGIEGSAKAKAALRSAPGELELSGSIKAELTVACVRCLETFRAPVDQSFIVKIVKGAAKEGEEEDEEEAVQDIEVAVGEKLDVTALLYDQLLIGLPEYPLCDPGCKGLCPQCGTDLNREKCGCSGVKKIDPRLAVLAGLKKSH